MTDDRAKAIAIVLWAFAFPFLLAGLIWLSSGFVETLTP